MKTTQKVIAESAKSVIPFAMKVTLLIGVAAFAYYTWSKRFIKWKENPNFDSSNITDAQAQSRANAIVGALGLFSTDFETVKAALSGLNYNAFVKVYNAFGYQKGTLLAGDLNLIEWLHNQFTEYQLQQLSLITNGAFFRYGTVDQKE